MGRERHLAALGERLEALGEHLGKLERLVDGEHREKVLQTGAALRRFSPVVNVVGQIKAGKTALINSLAESGGVLPTDVNPWTAVVTSLHLNSAETAGEAAVFRFFTAEEWDQLTCEGGRAGLLARSAELETELATLKRQMAEVHAKAKARLGRNFDMLLGAEHRFNSYDRALIERYVCLGMDDGEAGTRRGRFADLTRSADLYMQAPRFGAPITLRDTPGVNDPFLVREQVTLRSLGDTQVCVVVLSAHQALSTTDLALVRLLTTMNDNQILVFVNRIDELDDPAAQVAEIRERIRDTFAMRRMAAEVPVLFGSALWANAALGGSLDALPPASRRTLAAAIARDGAADPAAGPAAGHTAGQDEIAAAWAASGVPALQARIAALIEAGDGRRQVRTLAGQALNIARQAEARLRAAPRDPAREPNALDTEALFARINPMTARLNGRMETITDTAWIALQRELHRLINAYAERESAAFAAALDRQGQVPEWTPDPVAFRQSLGTAYYAFLAEVQEQTQALYDEAAREIRTLYGLVLAEGAMPARIEPPQVPFTAAPTTLGAALTVDMSSGWWTGWFARFRSSRTKAAQLARQIRTEARGVVQGLEEGHIGPVFRDYRAVLADFLEEHCATLYDLVPDDGRGEQTGTGRWLGRRAADKARLLVIAELTAGLEALFDAPGRPAPAAAEPLKALEATR
ncbi:dynamin family protein [Paralimibaculum aggregatum]|uniref:Dynamin family protein n=1 Tax=Paralimibaculum aggregatum TaxID=3036245 RepID=A0ABQ6LP39_9RHOB|nr:dynamin family protein [Limibaculum sp. NKW23]